MMNPSNANHRHILDALRSQQKSGMYQQGSGDLQSVLAEQTRLLKEQQQQSQPSSLREDANSALLQAFLRETSSHPSPPAFMQSHSHQDVSSTNSGNMNVESVLASLLSSQQSASRQDNNNANTIQNLIGLQLERLAQSSNSFSLHDDEARLRRLLESSSQRDQQQQELQSLEEIVKLRRLQQFQMPQPPLIGARDPTASVQQHSPRRKDPPSPGRDKLLLPVAQGLLRQPQDDLTMQEQDAVNSLFGISNFKKRKSSGEFPLDNMGLSKKRPAVGIKDARVTFPLPTLQNKADTQTRKTQGQLLVSYRRAWDELKPLGNFRKEIFLRRLHAGKVSLVGRSRSVMSGESRMG